VAANPFKYHSLEECQALYREIADRLAQNVKSQSNQVAGSLSFGDVAADQANLDFLEQRIAQLEGRTPDTAKKIRVIRMNPGLYR
jgi:hypothetical protein